MRIASWNVNSIRSRIDRVIDWLDRSDIDVLLIQETKCRDDQFPFERFDAAGYEVAHVGFNQWNGVAIASRVGLDDVAEQFADQPSFDRNVEFTLDFDGGVTEARAVGATCGGVRVWSLYVPNGRALDDPHYTYKLDWLAALLADSQRWLKADTPLILGGDWNIAPTDDDVWSVEYFATKTHTSPRERAAFDAFLANGFTDLVRPYADGPGHYTYWDYTQLRFPKRQGMKIDFMLGSPAAAERMQHAFIDREERKGTGASDHAPVVVELT